MRAFYEENPSNVKEAEIVVGILPWNETKRIGSPTEKVDEGLVEFFPDRKSVIISCDNHSDDGTQKTFFEVETRVPKIYLSTPKGVQGKGNSLRNLFRKAVELDARAVIVVQGDPVSVTPRWIKNLGDPLFRNFGFVSPLYLHDKFDGMVTNNLAYPLTRALYGRRIRQPIAGDFAFSGRLAQLYSDDRLWDDRISQLGIDIWMITLAITQGIPICQSFMGRPAGTEPADPTADLRPVWNQVVGTIFTLMARYVEKWRNVKWSKPTAIFGFGQRETETTQGIRISKKRLYSRFIKGIEAFRDQWKDVLANEVFSKVTEVADIGLDHFDFPTELWAKILFDYAVAFQKVGDKAEHLLDSLHPLFYGRVLSYVNNVETISSEQAEQYVEDQCIVFEETKPYLIKRWDDA